MLHHFYTIFCKLFFHLFGMPYVSHKSKISQYFGVIWSCGKVVYANFLLVHGQHLPNYVWRLTLYSVTHGIRVFVLSSIIKRLPHWQDRLLSANSIGWFPLQTDVMIVSWLMQLRCRQELSIDVMFVCPAMGLWHMPECPIASLATWSKIHSKVNISKL